MPNRTAPLSRYRLAPIPAAEKHTKPPRRLPPRRGGYRIEDLPADVLADGKQARKIRRTEGTAAARAFLRGRGLTAIVLRAAGLSVRSTARLLGLRSIDVLTACRCGADPDHRHCDRGTNYRQHAAAGKGGAK